MERHDSAPQEQSAKGLQKARLYMIVWAFVLVSGANLWATLVLRFRVTESVLATVALGSISFCLTVAAKAFGKRFTAAVIGDAARWLLDRNRLFAGTVLFVIAVLSLSSISIVNDARATGTIHARPRAFPKEHYIPKLDRPDGVEYSSILLFPYTPVEITAAGRACDAITAYPFVPRTLYLSRCGPRPPVLVRIPVGAQMHLENGKLEVHVDGCEAAVIATSSSVAGVWIGAAKGETKQWHTGWRDALLLARVSESDIQPTIDRWHASPLHECQLGTTFSLKVIFLVQGTIPFASVEREIVRGAEPADVELEMLQ